MKASQLTVRIYVHKADPGDAWARAVALQTALTNAGVGAVGVIDKLAATLELLLNVAHDGVVSTPTIVVARDGQPFARYRRLVTAGRILSDAGVPAKSEA